MKSVATARETRPGKGLARLEKRALTQFGLRLTEEAAAPNSYELSDFEKLATACIERAVGRMHIGAKLDLIANELAEYCIDLGLCGIGNLGVYDFIDLVIYDYLGGVLATEFTRRTGIRVPTTRGVELVVLDFRA